MCTLRRLTAAATVGVSRGATGLQARTTMRPARSSYPGHHRLDDSLTVVAGCRDVA